MNHTSVDKVTIYQVQRHLILIIGDNQPFDDTTFVW